MFPDMPAEVFDAWLAPLIKLDGWPFLSEFSFAGGLWAQYLGGHSIQSIKGLAWKRDKPICSIHSFTPGSHKIINWIINEHVHCQTTPITNVKNGKGAESFFMSRNFKLSVRFVRVFRVVTHPVPALSCGCEIIQHQGIVPVRRVRRG